MIRLGWNGRRLELTAPTKPDGVLTACVRGGDIQATAWAYPGHLGFGDLIDFFADLERHWRGWKGARRWESGEGELTMTARHTGSHVLLDVGLRCQQLDPERDWDLRFSVSLDAGEELTHAATEVQREFGWADRQYDRSDAVPSSDPVDEAAYAYEQDERTYLDLVREHPRPELAGAATRVQTAAAHWQALAWARVIALQALDEPDEQEIHSAVISAQAAELLTELWWDVAKVQRGLRLPRFDRTGHMIDPGDPDENGC
ncbi:hypothetical protein JL107_03805 [Nakamurella flavida]|uniref:Uncharacterized protein n=1 Tax=Nakamurella flavida TaxID=363630 RepID=A0A938YLQ4_9ACTN|nr:DUF6228 family protein [Nakamurella flavida]MBM9475564.1 hypothetical protein [Nakamurella flavida]MDP9778160.1 hypothetical protein [Nakamurella flavida]